MAQKRIPGKSCEFHDFVGAFDSPIVVKVQMRVVQPTFHFHSGLPAVHNGKRR